MNFFKNGHEIKNKKIKELQVVDLALSMKGGHTTSIKAQTFKIDMGVV